MKAFIKVMKTLSEPNRVKIIKQQQAMCFCELQATLDILLPSVLKKSRL